MTNLKEKLLEDKEPYEVAFRFTLELNDVHKKAILDYLIGCTGNPSIKREGDAMVVSNSMIREYTCIGEKTIRGKLKELSDEGYLSLNKKVFNGKTTTTIQLVEDKVESLRYFYREHLGKSTVDENDPGKTTDSTTVKVPSTDNDPGKTTDSTTVKVPSTDNDPGKTTVDSVNDLGKSTAQTDDLGTFTPVKVPTANDTPVKVPSMTGKSTDDTPVNLPTRKNDYNNDCKNSVISTSISSPLQKEEFIENIPLHSEGIKNSNIPLQSEGSFTEAGKVEVPPTPKGAALKVEDLERDTEGNVVCNHHNITLVCNLLKEEYNRTGSIPSYEWADSKVQFGNAFNVYTRAKDDLKSYTEFVKPEEPKDTTPKSNGCLIPLPWEIEKAKEDNRSLFEKLKNPKKNTEYEVVHNWKVYYKSTVPAESIYNWCNTFAKAVKHKLYKQNNDFVPVFDPSSIDSLWKDEDEVKDYFCLTGTPKDLLKGLITEFCKKVGPVYESVLADKSLDWYLTCYTRHRKAA